jgi:hypothetical protein
VTDGQAAALPARPSCRLTLSGPLWDTPDDNERMLPNALSDEDLHGRDRATGDAFDPFPRSAPSRRLSLVVGLVP